MSAGAKDKPDKRLPTQQDDVVSGPRERSREYPSCRGCKTVMLPRSRSLVPPGGQAVLRSDSVGGSPSSRAAPNHSDSRVVGSPLIELFRHDLAGPRIGMKLHLLTVLDAFSFPPTIVGLDFADLRIARLKSLLDYLLSRRTRKSPY